MAYRSRRRAGGNGIGRGGVVALLVGVLIIGGAFWMGPLRPLPAELQLLALSNAEFSDTLDAVTMPPDSISALAGAVARAPLVLGVRNAGARSARPLVLKLSVPGRFRLTGRAGEPLPVRTTSGTPLVQYTFELDAPELPGRGEPMLLADLDTLWLEPVLAEYDCMLMGDSVPDFMPAPQYPPETLATVPIFYSFDTADGDALVRQSGLLTVRLDPSVLQRPSAAMPARGLPQLHPDEAPRPDLGPLTQAGIRTATCGDPESLVELRTVVWEGTGGARMYEVQVGGTARKLLYDLNRDDRVELELWDPRGDGIFRSSREASYEIPSFLRPLPARVAGSITPAGEPMAVDSAWLARFHDAGQGPFRFAEAEADPTPTVAFVDPVAPPPPPQPVDSAWLARFHDSAAGPFRFSQRAPPPTVEAVDTSAAPATPATRQPPRLLGTPVPWPPRDSVPR
jgi:hypothetical protein